MMVRKERVRRLTGNVEVTNMVGGGRIRTGKLVLENNKQDSFKTYPFQTSVVMFA